MDDKTLSEQIAEYVRTRAEVKLQALEKAIAKERKNLAGASDDAIAAFEADAEKRLRDEAARFDIRAWLTDAADRAKQISMVTHAAKYTHGDAKGSGVYARVEKGGSLAAPVLVHTGVLDNASIDTVGNAAALDVASLLKLSEDGESLLTKIAKGDFSSLSKFSQNDSELTTWVAGFSQALEEKEISSHKLSKQIYFPLDDGNYHLLGPLYASSVAQEVFNRINDTRYSDESKVLRKSRREGKYNNGVLVDYPNVAVQTFGGTKPQNISQLNSARGGKSYLFSCQPPEWKRELRVPLSKNAFWAAYDRRVWRTAKSLRDYLKRVEKRDSNRLMREIRTGYVDELIGELLQLAAEIQQLPIPAGWSSDSAITLFEQYWLDPMRADESFQRERERMDWIDKIAERFSGWLNGQLNKSKVLAFGDVEFVEWKQTIAEALKSDMREMVR